MGGRERLASGVAAIAGRKRAIARWKMSSRDPIRCPEDLCVCAATVRGARNRKRRGREREREKDNTERGVSAGVQIYAGATLMSAFVLFQHVYTLRIRSVVERNSDREISFRTFIHNRDSRIRISSYTFYYSAQRFVAMFTYLN